MEKVDARPSKAFFVDMISRDIDINYAILELIDNSIDAARKNKTTDVEIDLVITKDIFMITDNCGGMDEIIAKEYAFRFGRPSNILADSRSEYETGIFGIGMKRSLFKIGKYFIVESFNPVKSFKVEVDVEEWIKDEAEGTDKSLSSWDFQLQYHETDLKQYGTRIVIKNLKTGTEGQFNKPRVINNIKDIVAYYIGEYSLGNLRLTINGEVVLPKYITILLDEKEGFYPYFTEFMIDDKVKVKVLAGLEAKGNPEQAGWYVYGNERLILMADKSKVTGWGSKTGRGRGIPKYHPSHAIFRGIIFLEAKNPSDLPWNTTKSNLDTTSEYYEVIYEEFIEAYEYLSDTLNLYRKASDDKDDEKKLEILSKLTLANQLVISTKSIKEYAFKKEAFASPITVEGIDESPETINISFKVDKDRYNKLARFFPNFSKREIGKVLFDYYYHKEVQNE